jgi:type II secretory pathway component PulK
VPDIDTSVLPEAGEVRPNVFNVNTAPVEVLATLDGMTEQALNAIVKYRAEQPFTTRGELLALTEMTDALFSQIVEKVTVRSSTLKITSIGSVEEGRVRVRVTALVDLQESEPRIVYLAEG